MTNAHATRLKHTSENRAKWLEQRSKSLGASEVAAVMGHDKLASGRVLKSALEVWTDKVKGSEDIDDERMEWGLILEPVLIAQYEKKRHRKARQNKISFRSVRYPWLSATPDGFETELAEHTPIQAKTTDLLAEWKKEIPLRVQIQVQSELLVMGAPFETLIWLPLRERRLQWRDIAPHPKFQEILLDQTEAFWKRVKSGKAPDPDGSESAGRALQRLYPETDGGVIELPESWLEMAENYAKFTEALKQAKHGRELIKQALLAALGTKLSGLLPDGRVWQASYQTRSRYVCEQCQHAPRTEPFRVAKILKGRTRRTKGETTP